MAQRRDADGPGALGEGLQPSMKGLERVHEEPRRSPDICGALRAVWVS